MSRQIAMVDVSANNHFNERGVDWGAVKIGGYGAVMVKASEGTAYANPFVDDDGIAASKAGLLVGYYHFAHPGVNEPVQEADHALTAVSGLPRDLGLALDLEVQEGKTWGALADWAQAFHEQVRRSGLHCPIYTNDFFAENLPGFPWGARQWRARTQRPRFQVWAWQMTTPGKVPGIAVPTDVGYLHPDE